MPSDLVIDILKQVPALTVLGWVVWRFLRHMELLHSKHQEALDGFHSTLGTVAEKCHEVQRDAIAVMKDSSKVMGHLDGSVDRLDDSVTDLKRRMK